MDIKVSPFRANGEVTIPPSKSMAHRAIIAASLSNGKSLISNVDLSDDILATIEAVKKLGAKINIEDDLIHIEGIKDLNDYNGATIDCGESGSTLRFFIPIFSLTNKETTFIGKNRLLKRPQNIYNDIFSSQNITFLQDDEKIVIKESLKGGTYILKGDISSQFISGLLFTLPLLKTDSIIKILPPLESKSYIDLTLETLSTFGIKIDVIDELNYRISGNQQYECANVCVEGDYSQLAFFAVLGVINGKVKTIINHKTLQGDREILAIIKKAGGNYEESNNGYTFEKSDLNNAIIDLKNCPDLGPICMVLAAFIDGETTFINTRRLTIKESDRIESIRENFVRLGIQMNVEENEVKIIGKKNHNIEDGIVLESFKDHRILMSMVILASKLNKSVKILNAECVNKSYPNFFEDITHLKGKIEFL